MGNQRVGIFPPKSENSLRPIPSFDMMSKFPGSDHSCRRRYVIKLLVGKKKKKNEIYICEAVCDAVREWSEVTRPSADCQTTIFRRFKQLEFFWKKSPNGHATVVGGHATVGRLSNNVFWTFQAIRKNFEKSRWTVTRQWSESRDRRPTEVTRPSADCQTTFFGRFKRFGKILKKVAERSGDSGWGHATVGRLSNNVFWTFQAIRGNFFEKKSLNGHATVVGGHATIGRLSNNAFWTFQAVWENFEKSRLRSRDRRPTVKQRFLDVSSDLGKFEKSRWTVTWQWSEVTRLSADCQTTIFWTFQAIWENILKKVAERSRDSDWRSRDLRPTVKQRFLDVSSNLGEFWKKSLNVHTTVVGGHATIGRLSNNVFSTFQANQKKFWKKSLNGHATVVGGHATVGGLSNNVSPTFQAN